MKRRRVIRDEEERESDPLELLGLGSDRYVWPDMEDEDAQEMKERKITEKLHWEF